MAIVPVPIYKEGDEGDAHWVITMSPIDVEGVPEDYYYHVSAQVEVAGVIIELTARSPKYTDTWSQDPAFLEQKAIDAATRLDSFIRHATHRD